jgi:hypothetical protein
MMGANEEIKINSYRALEAIRQAVDERGRDYLYRDEFGEAYRITGVCAYVVGGKCACLIGLALLKLGLTFEELSNIDNSGINSVALPERVNLTKGGMAVFMTGQRIQDINLTWGTALAAAEVMAYTLSEVAEVV